MPYELRGRTGRQGTDNEEVPRSRVRICRCMLALLTEEPMPLRAHACDHCQRETSQKTQARYPVAWTRGRDDATIT